jgi:hypothetical protein
MECHQATISKEFALAAHSVTPASLRVVTDKDEPSPNPSLQGRGIYGGRSLQGRESLSCATCHREHKGAEFNLAAMNNAACQSCHQRRYKSFSTDHPEFGRWPYERRTRITFDHASHQGKHFVAKSRAFDCRGCHVEDATNRVQLLASYEQACASCHDEKIAASVAKGVPMFALPTLDVEALKAAGHDIGAWPEEATGDFDGRLPPVMKLLLAGDQAARDAMISLGPDFDFIDVDPDDAVHLAACAELARAIKSLFSDVGQRGPVAVRERLVQSLGPVERGPVFATLIAGLSQEVVRGAAGWLEGVDAGDEAWPSDVRSVKPRSGGGGRALRLDAVGVWSRDDATFSVCYQPVSHADPVLTAWLELLATTPSLPQRPIGMAMFKELTSATAAGLCASCHSTERGGDGEWTIKWRAYDRRREPRSLTKFSHGPHVMLPQLADCTSCHAIDGAADRATSQARDDPHAFVSDFAPMSKQQCAQCHTAKLAGESCQKCHNYHVDVVESWRRGSRRGAEAVVINRR